MMEHAEGRNPCIAVGGSRLLFYSAAECVVHTAKTETRSEKWPRIGHERETCELVNLGFSDYCLRCWAQQIAAAATKGSNAPAEARCDDRIVVVVSESDQRFGRRRLTEPISQCSTRHLASASRQTTTLKCFQVIFRLTNSETLNHGRIQEHREFSFQAQ